MNLSQRQALKTVFSDRDFREAFKAFIAEQVAFYQGKVVTEVRRSDPDIQKAAQHAGRLDAYETLFAEFELFAKRDLPDPLA